MSVALKTPSKLKPEIRLAQAISEFCACLGESRAREFKSLRTRSPPTAQDVIALTEEINRDGSRNHKAWMPYATRMAMFLERVQTLSRLGDFMVASSQNLMASGIWATIKITLGIAVSSLSFFKKVSELFLKIGRSSSTTKEMTETFPKSKELQDLLCEYLIVLVTFCKEIVLVLKKPTILQLTSPFVAFFDKEASKFETDLAHISSAIDRKAAVLLSQSQVETSRTIAKMSKTLTQWSERTDSKRERDLAVERGKKLQDKLSPRSDQRQQIATWRRYRKKGDVRWVFEDWDYLEWKSGSSSTGYEKVSTLLIHGKLGSGKTVVMANIVADLQNRQEPEAHRPTLVISYFCNDDFTERPTAERILGSIIQQTMAHFHPEDHQIVAEMEQFFEQSGYSLESMEEATVRVLTHVRIIAETFVIIDGLDSCRPQDAKAVIRVLMELPDRNETVVRPIRNKVRVCLSLRTGSPLQNMATLEYNDYNTKLFVISMTSPSSVSEMGRFIEAEFERRRHIRTLDKELEEIIRDVLVGASEGMYLWVALQIEAIFPLHGTALLSPADIFKLLESPPRDLAEAFKNALSRISDVRYGNKIFQLVAIANRPLTLAELKVALHVQPGDTDWSSVTLSMPQQDARAIVDLCGGALLELDEEDDTVRFIHHSVAQYLQGPENRRDPYCFAKHEADMHMGFVCTTYLNYSIFDTAVATVNHTVINSEQLANNVACVVSSSSNTKADITSKVIAAITRRRNPKPQAQAEVNIGQLLQQYMKPKVESSEVMAFSDYAHEHWVWHCNRLWARDDSDLYLPFRRLLNSTPEHVTLPWAGKSWAEIADQYPKQQRTVRDLFGPAATSVKEPNIRWALAYRHFGFLFEYLPTLKASDRSGINGGLIQDLFRRIHEEEDTDAVCVDGHTGKETSLLALEPPTMFEVVVARAARRLADPWNGFPFFQRRYQIGKGDGALPGPSTILEDLGKLVTFDGHQLVAVPHSISMRREHSAGSGLPGVSGPEVGLHPSHAEAWFQKDLTYLGTNVERSTNDDQEEQKTGVTS